MWRCNTVTIAHEKQKSLRSRRHAILLIRRSRRNADKTRVYEILVIERLLAKNKELMSVLRSCRAEERSSDDWFDLEIRWIDRRWRCKSLLNANVPWQKRQIWEEQRVLMTACFDADIWQCEVSAVWLIEASLTDVELRLLIKMSNLSDLIKVADLK